MRAWKRAGSQSSHTDANGTIGQLGSGTSAKRLLSVNNSIGLVQNWGGNFPEEPF
jgi:hypothetical protein